MKNKRLITAPNNKAANEIQENIIKTLPWSKAGIVSYNLPLLSALSVVENIMLPLCYSESMARRNAEPIIAGLLKKFGMEHALHYRQKRLNEYEILVIKFLRAIMRCPDQVIFVMPHNMVPSEDYVTFTVFADSLTDFEITIIEHPRFAAEYSETNFTEISYNQWQTHALKTSK